MAPKQAVTKESYADKLRKAMRTKAAEGGSNGNPLEFAPDLGTTRIRILPPVGEDFPKDPMNCSDSDMFYHTHKFHFIPDSVAELGTSKGRFMWIGKTLYDKDGKEELVLERDRGKKLAEFRANYEASDCEKLYKLD